MGKKVHLSRIINLYFLLALIIPLLLISAISSIFVQNYFISITKENHLQIIHSLTVQVEGFLEEPTRDLMVLRDALVALDEPAYYDDLFESSLLNNTHYSHLKILTSDGIIEYQYPDNKSLDGLDYSSQGYFQAIISGKTKYWSNTYIDTLHDEVAIDFALPLNDTVLVGTIHLEKLNDIFSTLSFDDHMLAGITDNNGVYIAHTDAEKVRERTTDPFVNRSNLEFETVTLDNQTYYASSSISDGYKWHVVLYEDRNEIMTNINQFIWFNIFTIVVSLFLILAFGTALNRSIMSNFNRFVVTTKEIAKGNYDIVPPESTFFEIENIIDNFMGMVERIKVREETILKQQLKIEKLNSNLEFRVVERTNELMKSNKSLEEALIFLKSAQTQLMESEKLASLGNLVAGLAHEINTPIGITLTAITYMQNESERFESLFEEGDLTKTDLVEYIASINDGCGIIHENIERATELVSSFKIISVDQSHADYREFSLCDYMGSIVKSLDPNLKRAKVAVNISCNTEVQMIANPGDLSQVMTNLIMNTILHAYDEAGGSIDISIERDEEYAMLVYRDYGAGIPNDVIDRIFDPFFTTKRGSGGSGLGLNIVYKIVENSFDGHIEVDSNQGQGTTFKIRLKIINGHLPILL